ncbi:MAG: histidine kinase N-terminal 7TM domain-containing protein [Candidatus Methanofastidiosia archaeon]|jgi:PAS domain S-box-containing protein
MWQYTPYTLPLVAASLISIVLAVYIEGYRRIPGSKICAVLLLGTSLWMVTYALELASSELASKIFWNKVQYFGIMVVPTAWFIFAVVCTGHEQWLKKHVLTLLSIVPVVIVVMVWTNEYHGLIWTDLILNTNHLYTTLVNVHGPFFWIGAAYNYILLLSGSLLLLFQVLTCSYSLYRWQISILFISALFPWGANAVFLLGINPFPHLDLTPFGFFFTNVAIAISVIFLRLGDYVPIARETIIEGMEDSVIVLDEKNRILDVNPLAQQLMGKPSVTGKYIDQVWPEWSNNVEPGTKKENEVVLTRENKEHYYDVRVSPLTDWRGHTLSRVIVLRDITDRKKAEQEIKTSLKEKEVLLQEIHHRVKNNLQIISSLLNLQSQYIKDKKYAKMFKESQNRIRSMALIHEKLYQSENLADINFGEYIKTLASSLARSYGNIRVTLKIDVEDVPLNIDTAIPCGLIINELIVNALQHAFPKNKKGVITVGVGTLNHEIELKVSDNGIGLPDTVDVEQKQSLGLRLVAILAEDQLNGKIRVERNNGTTFWITFPQ